MLEIIPTQKGCRKIYRSGNIGGTVHQFIAKLEFTDQRSKQELLQLVGPEELLNIPFKNKRKFKQPERFSDGSFPVFYSSLDFATAEAEVKHHLSKYIGQAKEPTSAYYQRFTCEFNGIEADLRGQTKKWPRLVDKNDYKFCNQVGIEAKKRNIDGLATFSVHRGQMESIFQFLRGKH